MLVVFGGVWNRNEVLTENPRVTGSIPVLGTDLLRLWGISSVGRALDF